MSTQNTPLDIGKETILILLPLTVSPEYISRLWTKYPGITIRWHDMRGSEKMLMPQDIPEEDFDNVTILCTQNLPDPQLVPKCHYAQLSGAGADRHANHPIYLNPDIQICTANGVHPPQIAEWVIAMWLRHQHHFARYDAEQQRRYWPTPLERAASVVQDSGDLRMGVLGYGAIGRQCARLAKTLRMDVIAFTRTERATPESRKDDSYYIPDTGDPDGLVPSAWFHGTEPEDVNRFLSQDLDVLVVCLPLTPGTRGILDEAQFEVLSRKKTFVINVARGPHIKTDALIHALETGKISGAALDVTDPEPLPPDHPLWKAPNVFITPHVSWQTPHYYPRILDILEHNLERLSKGDKVLNLVDKKVNY